MCEKGAVSLVESMAFSCELMRRALLASRAPPHSVPFSCSAAGMKARADSTGAGTIHGTGSAP